MIELYYWPTPNGHKITLFLEEAGLPYQLKPVNIGKGEQFAPEFLQISPNNKMPAIIDLAPNDGSAPLALFESGAILLYLADKIQRFIPQDLHGRANALQWLFWQVSGLGPMAGQNHHFSHYASEKIPYAIDRYVKETARLYAVLDQQLKDREYIIDEYSIVDMACYPWIVAHDKQQQDLADFPHIERWFNNIKSRPAVIKAYELKGRINPTTTLTDDAKKVLFGQDAHTIRRSKKEN
jgi:GSH-dependent disulfide-bond oxidoreductase